MSSSVKQSAEESTTESAECSTKTTTTNQSNKPNYSIDKLFDLKRFEYLNVLKFFCNFKIFPESKLNNIIIG